MNRFGKGVFTKRRQRGRRQQKGHQGWNGGKEKKNVEAENGAE